MNNKELIEKAVYAIKEADKVTSKKHTILKSLEL